VTCYSSSACREPERQRSMTTLGPYQHTLTTTSIASLTLVSSTLGRVTINLSAEKPEIHYAIRFGRILANIFNDSTTYMTA
jgi:hypothetical protein